MTGDMMLLAEPANNSGAFNMILLLLIPVAFYFLLIRPQNKRRREQLQMQTSIEPGTRVLTTNGMYATVVSVDDDDVVLEVAPGVQPTFVKAAIMRVLTDDVELDDDDDDDDAVDADATDSVDDDVNLTKKSSA